MHMRCSGARSSAFQAMISFDRDMNGMLNVMFCADAMWSCRAHTPRYARSLTFPERETTETAKLSLNLFHVQVSQVWQNGWPWLRQSATLNNHCISVCMQCTPGACRCPPRGYGARKDPTGVFILRNEDITARRAGAGQATDIPPVCFYVNLSSVVVQLAPHQGLFMPQAALLRRWRSKCHQWGTPFQRGL